jgi:hypothetical protein
MRQDVIKIDQILIEKLEESGIDRSVIPLFVKDVGTIILSNPHTSLTQINERLQFLGWDNMALDYRTMELCMTCIESEECKQEIHRQ